MALKKNGLAGIQYAGLPGISRDCKKAVMQLIQFGVQISFARILTYSNYHCLLLENQYGDKTAVKSGFSSGYGGEGPSAFSYVLKLLEMHEVEIDEYRVDKDILERIDLSGLTCRDIEVIAALEPIRPTSWHDYILERDWDAASDRTLWRKFPPVVPFGVIDSRILDLALSLPEHPDNTLITAYRRLEDIVRKRSGIDEHGAKLFSQVFQGQAAKLGWKDIDPSEKIGRANLFSAVYMAYRNPRAHQELESDQKKHLAEFMLINQLYLLESEAVEVISADAEQVKT